MRCVTEALVTKAKRALGMQVTKPGQLSPIQASSPNFLLTGEKEVAPSYTACKVIDSWLACHSMQPNLAHPARLGPALPSKRRALGGCDTVGKQVSKCGWWIVVAVGGEPISFYRIAGFRQPKGLPPRFPKAAEVASGDNVRDLAATNQTKKKGHRARAKGPGT